MSTFITHYYHFCLKIRHFIIQIDKIQRGLPNCSKNHPKWTDFLTRELCNLKAYL